VGYRSEFVKIAEMGDQMQGRTQRQRAHRRAKEEVKVGEIEREFSII
jgi:hypothetical protein